MSEIVGAKAQLDQSVAEAQSALDDLVEFHRKSLARKRERHGEKFDNTLALPDLLPTVMGLPDNTRAILLSTAVNRLAQEGDHFSAELAELDFEAQEDQ